MKKIFYNLGILSIVLSMLLTSCVSNKRFMASEARTYELQQDSIASHNQLIDYKAWVEKLQSEKLALQNQNIMGQQDLQNLTDESHLTIENQAKRLKDLQNIINKQNEVMNNLKNSISDALMNYEAEELSVYIKDGNVHVALQDKLLFKSGSDVVDPKGKEALKKLTKVLIGTDNINVNIEGHTDNVPINTDKFKDNWELSGARAISIVRLITENNGFNSNRITASGRGQYHPIQTNDTEKGRAANRRTEVILSPDMGELYKILN